MTISAAVWQRRLQQWRDEGVLASVLPEVAALANVLQSPQYHAEGDALTHTLLAVAAVPETADQRVFWAVLLHDIGKTHATAVVAGRLRSPGHTDIGAAMAPEILSRFALQAVAADVAWLIQQHHFALSWGEAATRRLTARQRRFCHHRLFPLLVVVCRCDALASLGHSRKGELLEGIVRCTAD